MPYFKKGDYLRFGHDRVEVISFIAAGSQADVYKVYNIDQNRLMAMKHLYGEYSTNSWIYYKKVEILCKSKMSQKALKWPLAVSDYAKGSFAYLMELYPPEYKPIATVIKKPGILTFQQKKQLAIKVAEEISKLNNSGFVYGDISGTNIQYCIDENGKINIVIIDCDNISLEGQSLGLLGTGVFRAPELILGKSPTIYSDAHALAVVVFRILVGEHPLDGQVVRLFPFTPQTVKKYYAKNPEYIFADGTKNKPLHKEYIDNFNSLSKELRLYFNYMFCQTCLHNPEKRPGADKLLYILQHF